MKISNATKAAIAALVFSSLLAGCKGGDTAPTDTSSNGGGKTATTTGDTTKKERPVSPAPGNKAGDTIIVGLVASQNGDQKPWGDDNVKGAQLALDDFNHDNPQGIQGKKIDLRIGDSGSKPEQGKSAAEKLIADGALALDGEVASGITMQMGEAAFEKGVPVVAVGATRTDLMDKGTNMFRVCYADDFQGAVMANFAYKDLGLHKVAIITDKKLPYSTGLSDNFRATFVKLGGEIVDEEFYEGGQKDFKGQLTNAKAKNPEGMYCSGYFTEVGPLLKQAHDLGINTPFLGGDGWDSPTIITAIGNEIVSSPDFKAYFSNHYNDHDSRPQVKTFLDHWAKKYNGSKPGTTMGALGYDAMSLTLDAIKRAKTLDSKSIIEALENTEKFAAVSGDITLKGMNGTPLKRALVDQVTKDGFTVRKDYAPDQVTR